MRKLTLEERVVRLEKFLNRSAKNESSEHDGWRYTEPKNKIIKNCRIRVGPFILPKQTLKLRYPAHNTFNQKKVFRLAHVFIFL